ncbi:MAG TPA: ferritin-like domain-containing protein [Thermomicrobiales bacterium]|nr:ferritin-like domain-containing protein [Thermomicrobiales bacterium]
MPVVDRREFGGRFGVKENSQRLSNYRYLEIQLMEMIGGWSHTTPPLALKATFGYHVYDHAQAANMLGERLEQLRSGRASQEPATDEFAQLCEYVWNLESVVDRLVAVYRVLEPHLVSTYVYHADATDPMTDTPTVRLLRQLASIGQSHVAWGQAVLDNMTRSPEERRHALEVQADIEGRLLECGGVTGQGIESHWLAFHSAKAEDKAPTRVKRGKGGYRFTKKCPPLNHPMVEEPFWFSDNREDFRVYQVEEPWSIEDFRQKFHQLLYGEVETTDRMGKMLAEFPDLPWEMRLDMAHQMWDEARHIEIVAKAVEEELGAELGYGPWSLLWWWMQNDPDPLKRLTVTNSWAEANLMHTLREWRTEAEKRGYTRIAELADYLQADERTHVLLGTDWIGEFTRDDPERREELVRWGTKVVEGMQAFWSGVPPDEVDPKDRPEVRFTFNKPPQRAAAETAPAGE